MFTSPEMTMIRFALLFLLPGLAIAGTSRPISPAEFEAIAEGHTLHFTYEGRYFGAESFYPKRQTIWRHADGSCQRGIWTAEKPQEPGGIFCFAYEGGTTPCWTAEMRGQTLVVTSLDTGGELSVSTINRQPLECRQSTPTS